MTLFLSTEMIKYLKEIYPEQWKDETTFRGYDIIEIKKQN